MARAANLGYAGAVAKPSRYTLDRVSKGMIAAFAIGLFTVTFCNTIWAMVRGEPVTALWEEDASKAQILLASAPFFVLTIAGVHARRPWVTGLILTALFWGYYLYEITRPYEGGGANIGLGILMLFSPVPITIGCFLARPKLVDGRKADDLASNR